MKLYIFRHGETIRTKTGVPYGNDIETAEILDEGMPAIKKLAKYLEKKKTNANYTSPYLRCIQTVEIITEISKKSFQINNLLSEYREDLETIDDFIRRVNEFYNRLNSQCLESAAIYTHGAVIAGLTSLATKREFLIENLLNFPKPGVLWEIKDKEFKEISFN